MFFPANDSILTNRYSEKNLFYFNSNRSNYISIEACLSLVIGVTNSSKNFTVTYTGHSKWKKGWWKDKNENFYTHNNLIVKSCVLYYFIFSQSNGLIILNNLGCCRILRYCNLRLLLRFEKISYPSYSPMILRGFKLALETKTKVEWSKLLPIFQNLCWKECFWST